MLTRNTRINDWKKLYEVKYDIITNESLKTSSHLDIVSLFFDQQWKKYFDVKHDKLICNSFVYFIWKNVDI